MFSTALLSTDACRESGSEAVATASLESFAGLLGSL